MLDTSENGKPTEFEAEEEASRVFANSAIRGASSLLKHGAGSPNTRRPLLSAFKRRRSHSCLLLPGTQKGFWELLPWSSSWVSLVLASENSSRTGACHRRLCRQCPQDHSSAQLRAIGQCDNKNVVCANNAQHAIKPIALLSKYPWNETIQIPRGLRKRLGSQTRMGREFKSPSASSDDWPDFSQSLSSCTSHFSLVKYRWQQVPQRLPVTLS